MLHSSSVYWYAHSILNLSWLAQHVFSTTATLLLLPNLCTYVHLSYYLLFLFLAPTILVSPSPLLLLSFSSPPPLLPPSSPLSPLLSLLPLPISPSLLLSSLPQELCMASYSCQVAKLHIEHYIHHLLNSTPGLNELPSNAMVTSHIPSHNPTHLSPETARLKDCISVLFIFERRPTQDESFTADCRRWLDILVCRT